MRMGEQAERGPNPSDKKGKGTCVEPNPLLDAYQPGAVISARWSTVAEADREWRDLRTLIRSCGWELLLAAWVRDADSSYRVQAMAVPSHSLCTRENRGPAVTRRMQTSFLRRLRLFETERKRSSLRLYTEHAYIGPGIAA